MLAILITPKRGYGQSLTQKFNYFDEDMPTEAKMSEFFARTTEKNYPVIYANLSLLSGRRNKFRVYNIIEQLSDNQMSIGRPA
jgi:hypothetical protein